MDKSKKAVKAVLRSVSGHRRQLQVFMALVLVFGVGWLTGSGHLNYHTWGHKSQQTGLPAKLDYSSVTQVYNLLKDNYDGKLNENTLLDGMKQGMVDATGDPYTEYMNPTEAKEFNGELDGSFEGIGAQLSKDGNNIVIVAPLAGTPAEKAGLKPHDIIAAINGVSTGGMSVDTATDKIRGTKGTTVKLTIVRDGRTLQLSIVRATITVPSVTTKTLTGNIGYIAISRFGDDTSDLANKAATTFEAEKVKGIVLDLRGDPGGYLDAAVNVSSLWLPADKTILTERRGGVITQTYTATGNDTLNGVPTVVLIDAGSASASEITAGALHDNKAATLIGVKSYGKGSVQEPEPLSNGGLLKVTIARWYTPDGKNIDKQGITPDKVVTRSDDDVKNDVDPQLDAATQLLLSK